MLQSRYLRVQDLHRLRNHFFSSKRPVEGYYAGRHASPRRGHSVEFSDYRQYTPGDSISDIDWKVFGRSDRLFVKLFEHQSDMAVNLLVDGSASMAYGGVDKLSRRPGWGGGAAAAYTKFDHAALLAAAVGFLTIKQQDQVSFGLAAGGLREFRPAQSRFSGLAEILQSLEAHRPQGPADLPRALRELAGQVGRRGLLIVFSDLLDDQAAVLQALSLFTHRGGEIIVFHILHADELNLPDVGDAVFQDSETDQRVRLNVDDVHPTYQLKLRRFLDSWRAACAGRGVDYSLVSTAANYSKALEQYLFSRAALV